MTRTRVLAFLRSHWGRLRLGALAALGVLIAHDAVFAAQYGLGAALDPTLAAGGHAYWPVFVLLTVLVAGVGAAAAASGILRLHRLLRGLPSTPTGAGRTGYLGEVRNVWLRLFLVVLLAFLVQENVEHVLAGEGLPGLWVLSAPEYPLAVPVIVLVTGLLAAVGGWLQWHRHELIAQLVAARSVARRLRRHSARAPHGRWALLAALLANRWALLRRVAERAPPGVCAA